MKNDLIKFWKECNLETAPYFHPADKNVLFQKNGALVVHRPIKTYSDYMHGPEFSHHKNSKFHLSLLPMPYGGNLKEAEIVILLLNPGLSNSDYYGELENKIYRRALENNLNQNFSKTDFPFLWLNPEFCWHGGFIYWEKKLREILKIIADKKHKGCYLSAMKGLSQKIAMVELIPYHSLQFNAHGLIKTLPSVRAAQQHVQQLARSGEKTLIVLRQKSAWNVKEGRNIIVYDGPAARGASLSPNSKGGQAIMCSYCL